MRELDRVANPCREALTPQSYGRNCHALVQIVRLELLHVYQVRSTARSRGGDEARRGGRWPRPATSHRAGPGLAPTRPRPARRADGLSPRSYDNIRIQRKTLCSGGRARGSREPIGAGKSAPLDIERADRRFVPRPLNSFRAKIMKGDRGRASCRWNVGSPPTLSRYDRSRVARTVLRDCLEVSRPIRPAYWRAQGRGPVHPEQDRPHDVGWREATIAAVQRRDRRLPLPARARDARGLTRAVETRR